jgi:hypothetical protein
MLRLSLLPRQTEMNCVGCASPVLAPCNILQRRAAWSLSASKRPRVIFDQVIELDLRADVRPERFEEVARKIVQAKPDVIALGFDHQQR